MSSRLERFCPLLAAAILAWPCWSDLTGPGGSVAAHESVLADVAGGLIDARAEDERPPEPADPFFADWAPYGPEHAEGAVEDPVEPAPVPVEPRQAAAPPEKRHPSFTLRLESLLALREGGVARVNGQTVQVGEAIRGLDPEEPPVLAAVRGAEIDIAHRGRTYTLHIDRSPRLRIEPGEGDDARDGR